MTNKEVRSFPFELRAEENEEHGRYIAGHAIVYDQETNIGPWDEVIERGALDDTDLKDIRLLVNHNTEMIPLARSRNNNANSTMQLSVEDDGLHIRADLDVENNADAKSLWSATARGDIDGMSFMFTVDRARWENIESEHPKRVIEKVGRVFEVSAVNFPAYAQTSLEARGLSETLESVSESLEGERTKLKEIESKKQKIRILSEVY